jgi:hypothetical protein
MKISVVADASGKIIGALIPSIERRSGAANSIQLKASASRFVHETDLPDELVQHLGKPTLAAELLKYRVQKAAKRVRLARG